MCCNENVHIFVISIMMSVVVTLERLNEMGVCEVADPAFDLDCFRLSLTVVMIWSVLMSTPTSTIFKSLLIELLNDCPSMFR